MQLTLLFDHVFYKGEDGTVFSIKHYNYPFFTKRYLQVFDRVRVLARISTYFQHQRHGSYVEGDGVEVISLGNWSGPIDFARSRHTIIQKLTKALSNDSAVIAIGPGTVGALAASHLIRTGHPYAMEIVGDPYDVFARDTFKHPLRLFFQMWFTNNLRYQCAHACAASYVTESVLQSRYPVTKGALSVACSDVELPPEAFVESPRPNNPTKSTFRLIHVAFLGQLYKGTDILISAISNCVRNGLDINLTIVGDGRCRAELEKHAASLEVSSRICFLGQLPPGDAIRRHLDQADLFVLPSRTEGLPRAMIEAMARGLPCIGSHVGGIPELLLPEDMVTPGNVQALADKIAEVVTNPSRMTTMSARNLAKAREYHENLLRERRIQFYEYVRDATEAWLKATSR